MKSQSIDSLIMESIQSSLSNYCCLQKKLGASVVSTLLHLSRPAFLIWRLPQVVARRAVAAYQNFQCGTTGGPATNLTRILPDHLCVMTDHRLPFLEIRLTTSNEKTLN